MIDREAETKLVLDALNDATATRAAFFEFTGLAGIGKTWLLDHNRETAAQWSVPSVRVNVERLGRPGEGIRLRLTDAIIDQLLVIGGAQPTAYRAAAEEAARVLRSDGRSATRDAVLKPVAESFMAYLRAWLTIRSGPVLFIVDETERIPRKTLGWLNREILSGLVDLKQLVVIFAGRGRLNPDQLTPEIRNVLQTHRIAPFTIEFTREQIEQRPETKPYGAEADAIHGVTQGHPASNHVAVEHLDKRKPAPGSLALREERAALAERLRAQIIERYIFADVDDHLRPAIGLVAYPRRFDLTLLAELISHFLPTEHVEPLVDLLPQILITELMQTTLVTYDSREGGYRVDDTLARLIQTSDLILDPDRFSAMQRFLSDWHLKMPPDPKTGSDVRSLGDSLHHLAKHLHCEVGQGQLDNSRARDQLVGALQRDLRLRYGRADAISGNRLSELQHRFESDADLAAEIPGAPADLRLALLAFIAQHRPPQRAQLTITKRTGFEISFSAPDVPAVLNEYFNATPAGQPRLDEVQADLSRTAGACQRMFRLCLPRSIQDRLRQNNHPLQIITNHADQPWELMHDGVDFLCLRQAIGRMPAMQREPAQPAHPPAQRARFLLIADPTCDLPGSREEITAIAEILTGHADVTGLVGTDATIEAFINHLIDTDMIFDVIHYAGHAKFEAGRPSDSTLRLNNGLIYTGDIERALSYQPLVFLNACQASQEKSGEFTGGYLGSYTEGLVTSFLLGGARGCIGPLWSVPDGAARDFAVHFYQRLLDGHAIGEALRDTRNHMRQRAPKDSIWAAYVLHGDPTLKLLS